MSDITLDKNIIQGRDPYNQRQAKKNTPNLAENTQNNNADIDKVHVRDVANAFSRSQEASSRFTETPNEDEVSTLLSAVTDYLKQNNFSITKNNSDIIANIVHKGA